MKVKRHDKILELIENNDIETQEELCQRLKQSGFDVTQATVSRDIRHLKLTKTVSENGRQKYTIISPSGGDVFDRLIRVFKDSVVKIDYAQNIIVIKTLDGMGMAVGVALDNMNNSEILGTIAGDDTVFCVVRSNEHAEAIMERLYAVLNNS